MALTQSGLIYARYSDIAIASATISLTAGTANAAFPLSNLSILNPAIVFKATGTSCTIRFTYAGSTRWYAVFIFVHNLVGATVTLTNGAGLSQGITIPAAALDGHSVDPYKDLTDAANPSSTTWDLAITGASANVAIGLIVPVLALRQLPVRWKLRQAERMPAIRHTLVGGGTLRYPIGTRQRGLDGTLIEESARADLINLKRDALGIARPFPLIENLAVNEGLLMTFRDQELAWTREHPSYSNQTIELDEVDRGLGV
jgi:hypothetical protein